MPGIEKAEYIARSLRARYEACTEHVIEHNHLLGDTAVRRPIGSEYLPQADTRSFMSARARAGRGRMSVTADMRRVMPVRVRTGETAKHERPRRRRGRSKTEKNEITSFCCHLRFLLVHLRNRRGRCRRRYESRGADGLPLGAPHLL